MKYRFDNAGKRAARRRGGLGAKGKQLKSQLKMNVFISLAPFPAKRAKGKMRCVCARTSDVKRGGRGAEREGESESESAERRKPSVAPVAEMRRPKGWQDEGVARRRGMGNCNEQPDSYK